MLKPSRPGRAVAQRRRQWSHRLVALTLVLSGGGVTAAPVVETFLNNEQGSETTVAYVEAVAKTDPVPLSAAVERARAYNAALPPNSLPGYGRRVALSELPSSPASPGRRFADDD